MDNTIQLRPLVKEELNIAGEDHGLSDENDRDYEEAYSREATGATGDCYWMEPDFEISNESLNPHEKMRGDSNLLRIKNAKQLIFLSIDTTRSFNTKNYDPTTFENTFKDLRYYVKVLIEALKFYQKEYDPRENRTEYESNISELKNLSWFTLAGYVAIFERIVEDAYEEYSEKLKKDLSEAKNSEDIITEKTNEEYFNKIHDNLLKVKNSDIWNYKIFNLGNPEPDYAKIRSDEMYAAFTSEKTKQKIGVWKVGERHIEHMIEAGHSDVTNMKAFQDGFNQWKERNHPDDKESIPTALGNKNLSEDPNSPEEKLTGSSN